MFVGSIIRICFLATVFFSLSLAQQQPGVFQQQQGNFGIVYNLTIGYTQQPLPASTGDLSNVTITPSTTFYPGYAFLLNYTAQVPVNLSGTEVVTFIFYQDPDILVNNFQGLFTISFNARNALAPVDYTHPYTLGTWSNSPTSGSYHLVLNFTDTVLTNQSLLFTRSVARNISITFENSGTTAAPGSVATGTMTPGAVAKSRASTGSGVFSAVMLAIVWGVMALFI